jgi:hypothetical protein
MVVPFSKGDAMKSLSGLLLLVLLSLPVMAHPGVGIVQDSRGNVFLTDLKQVWKIAPDGQRSVAVPNVHTHELILDKDDNLYGEHLWYEGGFCAGLGAGFAATNKKSGIRDSNTFRPDAATSQ